MSDIADELDDNAADLYAMHVAGECGGDCMWCEEEDDLEGLQFHDEFWKWED